MTCRRCGGPITDTICEDCGRSAVRPPILADPRPAPPLPPVTRLRPPLAPGREPVGAVEPAAPSISRRGWAPRPAQVREPRYIARPVPRLTLVGIVIVLVGLGWFAIRSADAPAGSDLTAWKVGACVRITADGRTWPVNCEAANDGLVVRQVAASGDCPASAQWWVAREADGFCVRRNALR